MATFITNLFQFALVTFLALPAFGQVVVSQVTAYSGMTTTTTITITSVASLVLIENRDSTGHCAITYAEGDIPPHKMKAMQSLQNLCARYSRAQDVAGDLVKEFGISHYQGLKVSLEGAFGWPERYQINPINGVIFEAKKIARKYLRAKKKAQKDRIKKRLIRDALKSRR